MKKLKAYLESLGFRAIDGIKGYAYSGEELSMEVLFVGRKYIVRKEVMCRYLDNEVLWFELSNASEVKDLVAEEYEFEAEGYEFE